MTELELTSLLFQLADHGITGIKVKYDGGGDSGAIEWIGYTTKPCETPEDVNDNTDDWENDWLLAKISADAHNAIEEFAQSKLLDDIEDWWNNEGGWGELCICVPSGKYIINNHIRITESEDYFHDGSLLDKVEED
jgi:hypothetical protein